MWDWLVSTEGFVPRTQCGPAWTPLLVFVHEISHATIFLCYLLLYLSMLRRQAGQQRETRLGRFLWAHFILTCGVTHLSSRLMFVWPAYRLDAVALAVCALLSVAAVAWTYWPGVAATIDRARDELED